METKEWNKKQQSTIQHVIIYLLFTLLCMAFPGQPYFRWRTTRRCWAFTVVLLLLLMLPLGFLNAGHCILCLLGSFPLQFVHWVCLCMPCASATKMAILHEQAVGSSRGVFSVAIFSAGARDFPPPFGTRAAVGWRWGGTHSVKGMPICSWPSGPCRVGGCTTK